MMKLNQEHRNRVFFSFLISYAVLLLVPVIVSLFVYSQSKNLIVSAVERSSGVSLRSIQTIVDEKLESIQTIGAQILAKDRLKSLFYATDPLDDHKRYLIFDLIRELNDVQVLNNLIVDFFIFFTDKNFAVGANGFFEYEYFIMEVTRLVPCSQASVDRLISRNWDNEFFMLNDDTGRDGIKNLLFMKSISLQQPNGKKAILLMILDSDQVLAAMNSTKVLENGSILISKQGGEIFLSTEPSFVAGSIPEPSTLFGRSNTSSLNGTDYVLGARRSEIADWVYLTAVPQTIYRTQETYFFTISLGSLVFSILIGAAFIVYFLRKNYLPIKKIMRLFADRAPQPGNSILNEFGYIEQAVTYTLSQRDKMSLEVKRYNRLVRTHFIYRLMTGRISDSGYLREGLTTFNIRFHSNHFAVLLFQLNESDPAQDDYGPASLAIKAHMEALADGVVHLEIVNIMTDIQAFLINFKPETEPRETCRMLTGNLPRLVSDLETRFVVRVKAVMSSVQTGIGGIAIAYREALEGLEYLTVNLNRKVIDLSSEQEGVDSYYYPMDLEYKLIGLARSGKVEKTESLLHDLFRRNFSNFEISANLLKCFLFDVSGTIVKIVEGLDPDNKEALHEELNIIEALSGCRNAVEMRDRILTAFHNICICTDNHKNSHNTDLHKKICGFIQDRFADYNLSLVLIADQFLLSPAYLSRFFKEQAGVGLSDYIARLRIGESKTMLAGEEDTIGDIAAAVGYQNVNTFIRIFKKYEGITPGRYRELARPVS